MKLDDLVRQYMIYRGNETEANYERYYNAAVRGLRDLRFDVSGTPIVKEIVLDNNGSADLPLDFVRYIKVGLINEYGELISYGENPSLALQQNTNDCGEPTTWASQLPSTDYGNLNEERYGGFQTTHTNHHGENIGRFYGVKSRVQIGEFKIDTERNKLQVSSQTSRRSVILEYMSDIDKSGNDYVVHPFLEDAVIAYIEWKTNQFKKSVGMGEKQALKFDYYNEKRNALSRFSSKDISILMQYARKGTQQSKW